MARRSPKVNPKLKSSEPMREALAQLEAITRYGHNRRRIIADWVAFMFWGLQRNEPEYLAVLADYDHSQGEKQKVAGHFGDAFHLLMRHMEETNQEALGPIWMEFCGNEHMGQFFTPMEVSRSIARTTLHPMPEEGPIRILEPASGAGGMIVACVKEMLCSQVDRTIFVAMDLDRHCCMMTALNMCFFNVDGVIIHCNALEPEDVRGAWQTNRSYVWGGSIQPYPLDQAREWKTAPLLENQKRAAEQEEAEAKREDPSTFLLRPFEHPKAAKPRRTRAAARPRRAPSSQGSLFDAD